MRSGIFTLFFCLYLLPLLSQKEIWALDRYPAFNLPKETKKVTVKVMYSGGDSTKPLIYELAYDSTGKLLVEMCRLNNGWEGKEWFQCTYNKNGNKIKESFYSLPYYNQRRDTTEMTFKYFQYDAKGRLTKQTDSVFDDLYMGISLPEFGELRTEIITYNKNGVPAYEKLSGKNERNGTWFPYSDEKKWLIVKQGDNYVARYSDKAFSYTKTYDKTGRLLNDAKRTDNITEEYKYEYRENGLLKARTFFRKDNRPEWKTVDSMSEEYNEKGYKIKETSLFWAEKQEPQTIYRQEWIYSYDKDGNVVRVHWSTQKHEDPKVLKAKYVYSYE